MFHLPALFRGHIPNRITVLCLAGNRCARFCLPDTLGNLCDKLPTLGAGEALLIGEAVVMPSLVKVARCNPAPSSTDIPYYQLWKEEWKSLDFPGIKKTWLKE